MYYHTHVYYSRRIDKNLDPLKIVGSFLPDLALTSVINFNDLHKKKSTLDFFDYVKNNEPSFEPLLTGIKYHNNLDYTSHVEYKNITPGYAYSSITPQLYDAVSKTNVSEERIKASCHNYIENGVEFHILCEEPFLESLVKDSIENTDTEKLIKLLSGFFGKSENEFRESLRVFFSFVTGYDFRDISGWVDFTVDLNKYYLKVDIDKELTKEALNIALDITKPTYKEYLDFSIALEDKEVKDAN